MLNHKKLSLLLVLLGLASPIPLAQATTITYNDRVAFEGSIKNTIIDDFNSNAYGFINNAATMKSLSAGSIGYESTYFSASNLNIISGNQLCWGCNGSGQILLDDTTIGTNDGVFGFGLDITRNIINLTYDAFVTYGDGTSQNFDLGTGATFFGLTSTALIKQVQFGLAADIGNNGGSFQVDNVTIGNAVPEPATLGLLGLGLFALYRVRKFYRRDMQ